MITEESRKEDAAKTIAILFSFALTLVVGGVAFAYNDLPASLMELETSRKAVIGVLSGTVLFTSFFGAFMYISRKRMVHGVVMRAKKEWEETFDIITEAITIHDKNFNIIRANKAAVELLGISFTELLGQKCYLSYHGTGAPPSDCPSCRTLFSGEPTTTEIFAPNLQKYLEIRALPRFSKEKELIGLVHIVRDVTRRRLAEDKLRTLSLTDELTRLYNRRGFYTIAEQQMKVARRMKKGITVFYFDLDGLKAINDNFGHQEGCNALANFARVLEKTFRESDVIGRLGGDEFVVLSINGNNALGETRVERFYRNLESFNNEGPREYELSASVGMATSNPDSVCSLDILMETADQRMYERKRARRASGHGRTWVTSART